MSSEKEVLLSASPEAPSVLPDLQRRCNADSEMKVASLVKYEAFPLHTQQYEQVLTRMRIGTLGRLESSSSHWQ